MFKTRLLSGIVLVAAALVLIITGGDVLLFSTLLISYIGMFELYRIFHVEKELPGIVGYLAATVFYCNLKWAFLPDLMVVVLGFLMALMFVYVFTYPKYKTEQMLAVFFGVFYVAVMLSYVYQTRMLTAGAYIVWLIFLCWHRKYTERLFMENPYTLKKLQKEVPPQIETVRRRDFFPHFAERYGKIQKRKAFGEH